ncbi:MAG: ABC transporter substrate-binding protein [Rhodospirillaceae bacterium]|nr:ABC transporter substrate-binding protein [Rhodospirillaceae bacterium]
MKMKSLALASVFGAAALGASPEAINGAETATVRIGLASLPPWNGNPYTSSARTSWYTWRAFFDTLVQLGPDMAPAPALALTWQNTTPQTWVIGLRPGVTFSNGEPFNAEAVIANIAYLQSPAAVKESLGQEVENIAGLRALDPLTLEITTKKPDPLLPRQLAALPIVPPAYWAKAGRDAFALAPVGTGSFMVEKWGTARLELKAFPNSWRAPKSERVQIVVLPETSSRVQALLSGRIELASEIGPEDIDVITAAGFSHYQRPATSLEVIALNTLVDSPLKDKRVRQALNYAVDRKAITATILHGLVEPATQTTPRSNPDYDPTIPGYAYDPAKAKALLAEAGYPNGFSFVFEMSSGTSGSHTASVMQTVASDLAAVGVKMEIRPIPWSQYVRGVLQGEWNSQAFGFEYETMPTGATMRPFRLHSCSWPFPWYCDQDIMPVIEDAKTAFDPQRRLEATRKVLRAYHDNAAAILLYEPLGIDGLSPKLVGYSQVNGIIPYQDLMVRP